MHQEPRVTTTHTNTRTLAAPQCATHFHFNNSKRRFPISSFEVFWVPFRAVVFVSRMKRSIFIFFSFFLFRLRRCVLTLFRMLFSRSCWCSLSFVVCFACCLYNGRRYSPKTQMRLGGVAVETITKMTRKKENFSRVKNIRQFFCRNEPENSCRNRPNGMTERPKWFVSRVRPHEHIWKQTARQSISNRREEKKANAEWDEMHEWSGGSR